MATQQSYKNDEDTDSRLNPAELHARENNAIPGYDRKNDGLDDHPISGGDASGKSGDLGKNIDDAKDAEENPSWKTNITGRGVYGDKPFERGRKLSRANIGAILKRKGPLGLIVTIFLGGSIGFGSLFGGALAPMAFVENVTDDLNDQLAAADIRGAMMSRNKIPRSDVKESIAGCTKLSIRCKFKTMSAKQVARYERAGITVKGESTGILGKRIAPTEYTFRGQPMSAQQFNDALKTNSTLRVAYKRALNMKFLALNDNTFVKRTLSRFGISKRAPELKGTHQERVNALMNKAGTNTVSDVKIIPALDADGDPILGPNKEPLFHIQGDTTGTLYTDAQRIRMEADITRATTAQPPSRLTSNLVKGLSILGYWDLACTVKNMIGGAAVAAKLANQYELAQYAMPVLSMVSKMKAGSMTVEDGQVIGEFFGATDNRKQVVDLENSVTADMSTGKITPNAEVAMIDNPDYGKNVMDSPLYKISSSSQFNSVSTTERQYSLGMGQNALLSGFSQFAEIANVLTNLGGVGMCSFVQNWAVRGIGLVVGIAGAIVTGGGLTAVQAATSGGLIVASMILEAIINNALSGSVLSKGMSEAPLDRAAAQWSGTASILSEAAKNRGMIPGNTEQIMAYNNLQVQSKNDYIAVAREESGPFDITNQYSFLGSLSRSLLPYVSGSNSINSTLSSTLSFTANSFGKIFTPLSSYAAPVDESRFKQCDDQGYLALHIDPDVQCNLRYVMPTADLALDTDAVALYMETHKYVETDTTTGLPVGYTPPAPSESQGIAMDLLNGTINTFYNTRNYGEGEGAEYGKFLDYCAYRIMPIGETFEEVGQINGVDPAWVNGSMCLKTDSEMISNFRIYTLDKSLSEAEDEDAIVVPTDGSTPTGTTPTPGGNSGNINPNGWAFPTTAGAPLKQAFSSTHFALDIGGDPSNNKIPIYAMRDGVVMSAGNMPSPYLMACVSPTGTIQQTVVIKHEVDGVTYYSAYHHVQAGSFNVQAGSVVKAGDQIALMGNTGCSFGQHLHVELWRGSIYGNGTPIDLGPILYG